MKLTDSPKLGRANATNMKAQDELENIPKLQAMMAAERAITLGLEPARASEESSCPAPGSANWAGRLVAGWCRHAADELTPRIKRCHRAYKAGPMVPEVAKYAEILERHQREWREAAAGWGSSPNDGDMRNPEAKPRSQPEL